MSMNKKLNRLALALASSSAVFMAPGMAFELPTTGYVQYGDAQSYSLPVLGLQAGCDKPGCEFYVVSTPGAIKGLTVLGTGSSGTDVTTNFVGMDNAYMTPTGKTGDDSPYWTPTALNYSGGTEGLSVFNNGTNTWDTSLLALKTYLTTTTSSGTVIEQMIFFFNNNQTKSGGTFNESLAAWAQLTLKKDIDGNAATAGFTTEGIWDLTNRGTTAGVGGSYLPIGEGGGGVLNGDVGNYTSNGSGPVTGDRTSTDYVLSGGYLCLVVNAAATPGADANGDLVTCPASGPVPAGIVKIDHNLGANQAAYALMFKELNALLDTLWSKTDAELAAYTLSVDVRLGCDPATVGGPTGPICQGSATDGYGRNLNNGFEQIFISKGSDVVNIPEPGTLVLAGLALLGLGMARRRKS